MINERILKKGANMKIFVTGATGYVGSAVCNAMITAGHEIVGLTSKQEKANVLQERGIKPVVGDMRDESILAPQAEEAEITIMCAQLSFGKRFTKKNLVEFADAENKSVRAVVKGASKTKRKVIYTAGYLVFGSGADGWTRESCGYDPPLFSEGGVEATKHLLAHVEKGNVTGCMIAPGFVYGPGGMFKEMVAQIKNGKFALPGGGQFYWSPVYLEDLAVAYVAAVEGKGSGKGILVVDDEPMLMRDIMYAIADNLNVKRPRAVPKFMAKIFIGSAMVDGITTSRRCKNDLAKKALCWKPAFEKFSNGLPTVLEQLAL